MRRGLSQALDECLAQLQQGESIEACLRRFPRERDELEPLLRLAQNLRAARAAQTPNEQALARGRAAFLGQAVQLKQQAEQQAQSAPQGWLTLARGLLHSGRSPFARALMTLSVTLALVLGVLAGGNIASANSLPGDPLYGVKRASEQVRILVTVDADSRAALEDELAELRVSEVKQVLEQGRETQVDLNGVVEKVDGDRITIQGITVQLAADSLRGQAPEIGSKVTVLAQTQKDGTVQATALNVRAAPAVPQPVVRPATQTPTPTQPAEIRPTKAQQTATPKPTDTLVPSPTYTSVPSVTATVQATAVFSPTATLAEASATATLAPSPTPEPTATIAPPPRDTQVRIEGRIDVISSQEWTVSGQRLKVRSSTRIRQESAKAEVGGWAVVDAIKQANGELEAREIVVLRGADQPPQAIEFGGLIEAISSDSWVVAGRSVQVTPETAIEGSAQVGAIAHVTADQYADGRLVARRITVQGAAEQIVQFEGIIQSMDESRWVVAGQELVIDGDTRISGQPTIGAVAEVEAVVRADGSKLARSIRVKTSPSPEPTPVPTETTPEPTEATPVPSQTLVAAPTATVAPQDTPAAPTAEPTQPVVPTTAPTMPPVIPVLPSPAAEVPAPTATIALTEASTRL